MRKFGVLSFILLLLAGCSFPQAKVIPTEDVDAIVRVKAATVFAHYTETSAALQATLTKTSTLVPPTAIPSATGTNEPIPEPVDAVAESNVTVYDAPNAGVENMGGIFSGQSVQVIARNENSSWYYIQWPKSPTGTAWVPSDSINLKENNPANLAVASIDSTGQVMVSSMSLSFSAKQPGTEMTPISESELFSARILDDVPAHEATPTLVPTPVNPTGEVATFELHVRSGPATSFALLGTLHHGDIVTISGMTINKLWYRIIFAAAPDGYGYVSLKFIDTTSSDMSNLHYLNNLGTPVIP